MSHQNVHLHFILSDIDIQTLIEDTLQNNLRDFFFGYQVDFTIGGNQNDKKS
jgi:hypothetical protein